MLSVCNTVLTVLALGDNVLRDTGPGNLSGRVKRKNRPTLTELPLGLRGWAVIDQPENIALDKRQTPIKRRLQSY